MRTIITLFFFLIAVISSANPMDNLLERIDKGASKKFKTELIQSPTDFFELSQEGNRIVIKGNTWVNIAVGLNWYLKYYAGIHLTWNNMNTHLPASLPRVTSPERHETDLKLRYDFNYCTFSYSMAFWDWKRWQTEIDWMALHGVNLPLAIVGEEVAWRNMLLKLGYTKEEIGKFIAGPAFLAWWEMNNLEGWGGPLPDSWYNQQEALQKKILKRMHEYGMQPVLPGFCGMMPHDAKAKLGLNVTDGGIWNGYTRPANLSPTDAHFDKIADLYYAELTKLYGKANYYSMDPFHETNDDEAIDYSKAGRKVMEGMKRVNPNATWVIQGWTENPRPQMIKNMKNGDLLVLDLFSECRPMFGIPSIWKREKGYEQHDWLFCMLENFGANVGLHGRMDQLLHNFYSTKQSSPNTQHLKGIGFTMEGSENNPVMFELMSELPWRTECKKKDWIKGYVKARYGKTSPEIERAWQLLSETIYNCPAGNNQQGPHESIFCGRPSLNNFQVKSWSKMRNYYGNNNFEYDLVDICRQALADQGRLQYLKTIADYNGFSRKAFAKDAHRFLEMILLQDKLLGTRTEFRLGHWTEAARKLGTTQQEKDLYEWNARVQITTWGNRMCADKGGLHDYAHKEWQGILKDFYYKRWKIFMDALAKQMEDYTHPNEEALGAGRNANKTSSELFDLALPKGPQIDWYSIEEPWTLQHNIYSSRPEGDCISMAKEVIEFLK